MRLPKVSGANLERQKMAFPADFAGEANLVFVAFQQWHQQHVDSWVPAVERLSEQYAGLSYYEFPTIQPMNFLARTFINEGMRAGIRNQDTRARTITLYLDKVNFRRALEIPDEDDIWVMLFDKTGELLWRVRGPFSPEKEDALREVLRASLEPAPL